MYERRPLGRSYSGWGIVIGLEQPEQNRQLALLPGA
jgi:hypothetical protein